MTVTSKELAKLTGLTHRQIDNWCAQGNLQASGGGVQGHPRVFADAEVDVAVKMARLVRAGLTVAAAGDVARGDGDLGEGILVLMLRPDDGQDPADRVGEQ